MLFILFLDKFLPIYSPFAKELQPPLSPFFKGELKEKEAPFLRGELDERMPLLSGEI